MLSPELIPAVRGNEESPRLNLTEEEFIAAVEHQPRPLVVPLSLERPIPRISPLTIYSGLPGPGGFLLESMEGSEKIARYSFLGKDPESHGDLRGGGAGWGKGTPPLHRPISRKAGMP